MDLIFPHHECEIAQAVASQGDEMVHYWMHNNMITVNGQKMGKSLGNSITLEEFFSGNHKLLHQAYSPMIIRFFILQAHYRSTVDFSNEALQASAKGLNRLLEAYEHLQKINPAEASTVTLTGLREKCYQAMNDDLNTPVVISLLFDATREINTVKDEKATLSAGDLKEWQEVFQIFLVELLGIQPEATSDPGSNEAFSKAIDLLLNIRQQAKTNKDWATSDRIRNELAEIGFEIKDTKEGAEWKLNR
jgi:cysteinyl-tRNA synthetase